MNAISVIFDKMRATPMNDWIGGSDPEVVGDASALLIRRLLPINTDGKVLDFGCGIGRGLVSLLKEQPMPSKVVGMDIMPPVISFCREVIEPYFPNVIFELIEGSNEHYDHFIESQKRKPLTVLVSQYGATFDAAYAFSVFTHVDRKDFVALLKLVASLLAPGGHFLFTCFTLTEFSRQMIENSQSIFPLTESVFVDDGMVFWGNRTDPLAFIAFDKNLLEFMVWEAGLAITKIEYGCWMGGGIGSSLHDLVVVRKPLPMVSSSEIVKIPVVDRHSIANI